MKLWQAKRTLGNATVVVVDTFDSGSAASILPDTVKGEASDDDGRDKQAKELGKRDTGVRPGIQIASASAAALPGQDQGYPPTHNASGRADSLGASSDTSKEQSRENFLRRLTQQ